MPSACGPQLCPVDRHHIPGPQRPWAPHFRPLCVLHHPLEPAPQGSQPCVLQPVRDRVHAPRLPPHQLQVPPRLFRHPSHLIQAPPLEDPQPEYDEEDLRWRNLRVLPVVVITLDDFPEPVYLRDVA